MSNPEEVLAALKKRVSDAERARMLAEVQVGQARQQVDERSKVLEEKFGVKTSEEAKALIAAYRADLEAKSSKLLALMDKFEEGQCPMS